MATSALACFIGRKKMKKRTLFLTISSVIIVFSAWIAIVFFYPIVPGFPVADSRNETAESYGEITNVAPDFLPLGNDEAKLISNGNKIVSAIEKYFHENGAYPSSLEILVPDYISEIPKTGYKRTYLLSLKTEEAVYDYSVIFVKDDPISSEFSISVRYGMFDEWYYSSRSKVWEWANH